MLNDFMLGWKACYQQILKMDDDFSKKKIIDELEKTLKETLMAQPTVLFTKNNPKTGDLERDIERTEEYRLEQIKEVLLSSNNPKYSLRYIDFFSDEGKKLLSDFGGNKEDIFAFLMHQTKRKIFDKYKFNELQIICYNFMSIMGILEHENKENYISNLLNYTHCTATASPIDVAIELFRQKKMVIFEEN